MKSDYRRIPEVSAPMSALAAVVHSASTIIHAPSEEEMFRDICEAITADKRYVLAWVGWARDDDYRSVDILASAGTAQSYLDDLKISWRDDIDMGQAPSAIAIRTKTTQVCNDARIHTEFKSFHEHIVRYGIHSVIAVPVNANSHSIGVLVIYSTQKNAFREGEVFIFDILAENICFGIKNRREHEIFHQVFQDTISALATALEKRDPYTAGHERRVTDLAITIGKEMGLEAERLAGLRLASMVHDIGKIQIPIEILIKPGRLTTTEFDLIKLHSVAGYEILKDIRFPWPIAEIVRQHHEMLDGSGYPQGLRDEAILKEARILTVADIVEAMSSHRPYRPALGVARALEEVTRLKGSKLDVETVDACLRLFHEQHYEFPKP